MPSIDQLKESQSKCQQQI